MDTFSAEQNMGKPGINDRTSVLVVHGEAR